MPGPKPTSFESDLALPKSVDAVVIGGGIIGTSTALELADRGVSVLLCEKGQIGAEQSSRNWGWVRLGMRDPREIPLMQAAREIWQGLDERLGRQTGYRQAGIVFADSGRRGRDRQERWLTQVEGLQTGARLLGNAELAALMPGHSGTITSGLHMPQDGRAEPQLAAPAIAEGARDRGAAVMSNCAVRSVDVEAGRVAGVVTERGRVTCDRVVLAGGAWSRLFAGNADIFLPQLKVLNTAMRTSPVEGLPETAFWSDDFAMRKRADGGYSIASGHDNIVDIVPDSFRLGHRYLPALCQDWKSLRFRVSRHWAEEARQDRSWLPSDVTPFEHCRVLDPEPSWRVVRRAWAKACQAFPALASAEIVQSWAGYMDVTPDAIPVISEVNDLPGMFIATGFSGHGFGIGPAAGRLAADLVTAGTPCVDPHEFRLSRFTDGSRVRPDPGY